MKERIQISTMRNPASGIQIAITVLFRDADGIVMVIMEKADAWDTPIMMNTSCTIFKLMTSSLTHKSALTT